MNTGQNYLARPSRATNLESSAEIPAQRSLVNCNQQRGAISLELRREYYSYLLRNKLIPDDQSGWSIIISIADDRMTPTLREGGILVAYWLDPIDYAGAAGKIVAISPNDDSNTYLLGRLRSVNHEYVFISFDEEGYEDQKISLAEIGELYYGVYTMNGPLL